MLPVLALAAAAAPQQETLFLRNVTSADPLAVCVDGSRPYYYATPPGATKKWQIVLFGPQNAFSWCYPPAEEDWDHDGGNCYWGPSVGAPPAGNMSNPCQGSECIFSPNCTSNPTLCEFGRVWITACTIDGWLGDADRKYAGGTVTQHYRGQRVLNATIQQLIKDLDIGSGSTVMMMGYDGGANSLYIFADRIGALFAAAGVPPSQYMVVPIEGYWLRWQGYFSGDTLAQLLGGQGAPVPGSNSSQAAKYPGGNVWKYMNMQGAAGAECVATLRNESDHWQCLLAHNALRHMKSRVFAIEQVWGAFGSFCLVNDQIVNETAWHGWHVSCDPRDGTLHRCVEYGWQCPDTYLDILVKPYQAAVLTDIQATGFLSRPGNGLWMHSCHTGDEDMLGSFYNTIAVGNRTAQQALLEWYQQPPTAPSRFDPPCLWNETEHAVYKNNCNPTCPNIPYAHPASRRPRGAPWAAPALPPPPAAP
eukprot:TRINITY_DN35351_c0_g1_i1.p2 TRINITY_DN35351_c0_g1~~TRINITY_DN35351_c0_g1_i1.p2  ORF type:complete len:501 (+),score=147.19 TRINITY_DN35351_c0_g1_i1:78-1505(+)